MTKIVVIAGPTASGKSDLAIKMAQQFNGEIISADAMQIYRTLDVGTAKVSPEEQALVPHHLIDIVDVTANFSVADFVAQADQAIADIVSRGKLPIIAGGTGFYVKALLGAQPLEYVASDATEVAALQAEALPDLVAMLQGLDQSLAERVDLNNKQRVIRAIQIARHGKHDTQPARPNYEAFVVGLDWSREVLYERINARAEKMLAAGVLDEANRILAAGGETIQAGKAIGYKEFFPYLTGNVTLAEATAQMQQDSRRYAKRQLTYLRHQIPGLIWLPGQHAATTLSDWLTTWLAASE